MRNPQKVLSSLTNHSKDTNYQYERLYRILFNTEMYAVAYQEIYANEGNMTKGTDGATMDLRLIWITDGCNICDTLMTS